MYRGISLVVLIGVILALLLIPFKIPYTLVSIGSVLPSLEWRLIQDVGGGISATLQDNESGVVNNISSWQFERGDLYSMQLAIDPGSTKTVKEGDTLVRIFSSVINQQMLDIENQIKVKSAINKDLSTGEKPPIVQEAESKLASAKETYLQKTKELEVAKRLYDEGVMATLEYSRIQNDFEVAKIGIRIAEKALLTANTGQKVETVLVNNSEINSLRRQLDFLKNRNAKYLITSSFDGIISPINEIGQVMILQKVSECIVTIPIKVEEMEFLGENPQILVNDPISHKTYNAKLLEKSSSVQVLSMRNVGFLKCLISPYDEKVPITLGIGAKCEVHCDDLSPVQYLKRLMKFTISSN